MGRGFCWPAPSYNRAGPVTTDDAVLAKLQQAKDAAIDACLARLKPGREFVYAPKAKAEFYGPNKARYIDPLALGREDLVPVSGLKEYIEEFRERCWYIGVSQ